MLDSTDLKSAPESLWDPEQVMCPPGPLLPYLYGGGIGQGQKPARFFCKGPDNKYFRLRGLSGICPNYTTLRNWQELNLAMSCGQLAP